jgi:protease IV
MKKFLLGILVGLVVAALAVVILIASLARFGDRRPSVAQNSTLVLRLSGEMPEVPPVEMPFPWIGSPTPTTVAETWSILRNAASDSRIKAVILVPENVGIGWAKMQELHADLVQFRKSGKPLIAFLRAPGLREYYLATAAEKIYLSPEDQLNLKGLRSELVFLRKTLDKVGVSPEIYHIGKYKDAGDTLTETTATPETLEVMNSVLDSLYGNLVTTIATNRKRPEQDIRAIIDEGPFTSKQAAARGMVDGLKYEDQVFGELKDRLKSGEITKLSHRTYLKSLGSRGEGKRVAYLVGSGAINRAPADADSGSDNTLGSGPFIKLIQKVANDSSIDAVILRVDSPGGDASASDEILREMKLLSQKKPTVISMGDVAASGGYYIAMTGDPIIAYPGTLTGSIGIIYGKLNLRGLYDKLGVQKQLLTRGKNAEIDSDYTPLNQAGKVKLMESLKEFYDGFVGKAASARKKSYNELEPLAQGRVWLGSQAKANGLIDELGGIDQTIELLRKKAKFAASDRIRLVPYPSRRSIFDEFLRASQDNTAEAAVRKQINAWTGMDIKAFEPGGYLYLMPYNVRFQ